MCDTSKGLVALDGVMATAFGVLALTAVSSDEPGIALLPLGAGALYLAGAVSGNRTANECQASMDDYSRTYGDERMVLGDDSEGAPPLDDDDDDDDRRRRAKRTTGRGPGAQESRDWPADAGARPPQPGYPQQQTPYQQPRQPVTAPPEPPVAPQPPPQQPPAPQPPAQARPGKGKAPPPPLDDGDDDWSDFWREVP